MIRPFTQPFPENTLHQHLQISAFNQHDGTIRRKQQPFDCRAICPHFFNRFIAKLKLVFLAGQQKSNLIRELHVQPQHQPRRRFHVVNKKIAAFHAFAQHAFERRLHAQKLAGFHFFPHQRTVFAIGGLNEQHDETRIFALPQRGRSQKRIEFFAGSQIRLPSGLHGALAEFFRPLLANRFQHGQFTVKMMVKAAFGKSNSIQNVLNGGILIALRIEQLFSCGEQFAAPRVPLFQVHSPRFSLVYSFAAPEPSLYRISSCMAR